MNNNSARTKVRDAILQRYAKDMDLNNKEDCEDVAAEILDDKIALQDYVYDLGVEHNLFWDTVNEILKMLTSDSH